MTGTKPQWGTWKTHGHAAEVQFYGDDRTFPAKEGIRSSVQSDGRGGIEITSLTGERIGTYGDGLKLARGGATRFWAVPAVERQADKEFVEVDPVTEEGTETFEEVRHSSDGDAIAVGTRPKASKRPSGSDTQTARATCRDGCGVAVGRGKVYRQGHDARHVKQLLAKVVAGGDVDDALAELEHSPRLQAKLAEQIKRRIK